MLTQVLAETTWVLLDTSRRPFWCEVRATEWGGRYAFVWREIQTAFDSEPFRLLSARNGYQVIGFTEREFTSKYLHSKDTLRFYLWSLAHELQYGVTSDQGKARFRGLRNVVLTTYNLVVSSPFAFRYRRRKAPRSLKRRYGLVLQHIVAQARKLESYLRASLEV